MDLTTFCELSIKKSTSKNKRSKQEPYVGKQVKIKTNLDSLYDKTKTKLKKMRQILK